MKNKILNKKVNQLALILGMAGIDGAVSIAALSGLFNMENALVNSVLFLAGPGAIISALTLDGTAKQRMLGALMAGIAATIIVILAAGVGAKLLGILNMKILKIAGGLALMTTSLIIMGLNVPTKVPLGIILIGIICGLLIKV